MPVSVSVLMPAYNCASTVRGAVGSILRQTHRDLQVVIIDDGSTDATPQILDSLAAVDSRIRVIHAPHRGIIDALNVGIAACEGDLVARMDADDVSHPRRLELQVEMMRSDRDLSVCSCLVRLFPRRAVLGGMARYEEWLNRLVTAEQITRDIFVESPIPHPSAVLRRAELVEIGGYQEHGWPEDYDLWLRYHAAGKRFAKVGAELVYWRQTEGRLTFTDGRYSVENFLRAKAHYLAALLETNARPVVLWGAGRTGRRLSKHLIREGVNLEAVIDIDARKIGREMRGRPIVSPSYLTARKGAFVVAAVGSRGARELIREQLRGMGFAEPRDLLCAA